MKWPWSRRSERKLPDGIAVLDVQGAQLIIVRAQLSPPRLEELKCHLKSLLRGTRLEGVPIIVLGGELKLSVLVDTSPSFTPTGAQTT